MRAVQNNKILRDSLASLPKPTGQVVPPNLLFHWTSYDRLNRMAKRNPDPSKVPLRYIKASHFLAMGHPELVGKDGLYAWEHPTTGISSARNEIYGLPKDGYPARLLVMKPKKSAVVVKIRTDTSMENLGRSKITENADLLFNEVYSQEGKLLYREWVVLNANAIEEFTADPKQYRGILEGELRKLKTSGFHYPEEALFFSGHENVAGWSRTIQQVLEDGSAGIPVSLRRVCGACRSGQLFSCPAFFASALRSQKSSQKSLRSRSVGR